MGSALSKLNNAQTLAAKSAVSGAMQRRNYSQAAYTTRYADFQHLVVTAPYDHVLQVQLNRPEKRNAMTREVFQELLDVTKEINDDKQCRAVVITGAGDMFSAGIDYMDLTQIMSHVASSGDDVARKAKFLRGMIRLLQKAFNEIIYCTKPVIASVHGGCIGAAVDLISSVDVRYCSKDAYFSIREVDIGLAADLGTLQRLPKVVGNDSLVREMAFTAKNISAADALRVYFLRN